MMSNKVLVTMTKHKKYLEKTEKKKQPTNKQLTKQYFRDNKERLQRKF